jgi:Fe-S-cluster-containing dehydrogenase component/DMSO reductase anchor subunit
MAASVSPGGGAAVRSPLLRLVPAAVPNLVDEVLRQQQTLTAVDRFARAHDECALPAQARYYQELIPGTLPRPGQQYAFEVDLDACTGCKACVAACHSLNGLDEEEVWRTVGFLHGGTPAAPTQQTVTTSCHHCVDPACLHGCPVQAYEKDPVTGIVRHLDDQCIGCQYCTLMCPYDAPKFSAERGIVRKCDMCSDRLGAGEAPACVQGCPNQAIRIRIVEQAQAREAGAAAQFLAGAPTPEHTAPTTVYKGRAAASPDLVPADHHTIKAEHGHSPLVLLLVLTQMATGAFVFAALAKRWLGLPAEGPWALAQAALALATGVLGLGASFFHLGRPLGAWRAFLGLRTSWMSREAMAFAFFAKAGALLVLSLAAERLPDVPGKALIVGLRGLWEGAAIVLGLAGVFSSAMIYAATRRWHWRLSLTGPRFLATTALLGAAAVLLVSQLGPRLWPAAAWPPASQALGRVLLVVLLGAGGIKVFLEAAALRHALEPQPTASKRVALLMAGELRALTVCRFACTATALLLLSATALALGELPADPGGAVLAGAALVLLLGGELCERALFFRAAPGSRMPGGLA